MLACSPSGGAPDAGPDASASAAPAPAATPDAGERAAADDEVKPVYPVTRDPPDPLAVRLCDALHAAPAQRKAACCGGKPGFHLASECARTLSAALRSGAVRLAPADVDACLAAMERALDGCGWVLPLSPPPPPACDGIVRGALQAGARCRSSLECADGLRCAGAGPTDAGVCRAPAPRGAPCGGAVDTLASHARQTRWERSHPECAGHCAKQRCADGAPPAPPAAGAACPAGVCAEGQRCAGGRCVAPKGEGEACETDAECRAACLRPDAGVAGVCGKKCSPF